MWPELRPDDPIAWAVIRLVVSATLLVATAMAAYRIVTLPMWRRTITQAAAIGLLLILFGELTGIVQPLANSLTLGWTIGENPVAAPATRLEANTDSISIDDSHAAHFDSTDETYGIPIDDIAAKAELETSLPDSAATSTLSDHTWARIWLTALFLGAVWFLGRCLCDAWVVARLRRTAKSCNDAPINRRVDELAQKLAVSRCVRVLVSSQLASPVAWGVWRPTVGLPQHFFDDYDPLTQDAMLAHELAHHAAWDPLWRRIMDLVVALWWWHPLVWLVRSRHSVAAEAAADEASICVQDGPARLAAALVRLGNQLTSPRAAAWVGATGPFRSHLGQRVSRLLCLTPAASRNPRFFQSLAARCGLVTLLFLLSIFGTAWARPRPTSTEGELTMQRFTHSWRASMIGTALVGLWASSPLAIADDGDDKRPVVTVRFDDAARDGKRLRDGDDPKRDKRERDGQARHIQAVHAELAAREEAVRELKTRLGQLRDGQDKEAAEIKAKLDRVVAEMSKLRAQLKGEGADRERHEIADKRSVELKRLEHQLAEHKDTIARLRKEGRKDEAEKRQRQANELVAMLEKIRAGHDEKGGKRVRFELRDHDQPMVESAKRLANQQKELHGQLEKLAGDLKELTAAGKHDQAEHVKGTIAKLRSQMEKLAAQMKHAEAARDFGEKARRAAQVTHRDEGAANRAQHLYAAAKNLRQAGMSDLAEKLQREADQLTAAGDGKGKGRIEVELEFKRHKGDKPEAAVADLVSELKAMRREMDELRGQLKRLQGERPERRQ